MILSVCDNPDILKAMMIINRVINIIKIAIPAALIIMSVLALFKTLTDDNADVKAAIKLMISKFVVAAMIFLFPSFAIAVIHLSFPDVDVNTCFAGATSEKINELYIKVATNKLTLAESSLNSNDLSSAFSAISKIEDSTTKNNLLVRANRVQNTISSNAKGQLNDYEKTEAERTAKIKASIEKSEEGESLGVASYYSNGAVVAKPGVRNETEPDPSAAINYWAAAKGYLKTTDFIYPKDSATGKSLGAWPANYASIPTQLTSYNTYQNGTLVFPTTPENGVYKYVYNHRSIDIMTKFGTPIYAPADGQLQFSEWGHTYNQDGDETAYSVVLRLDKPFTVNGTTINAIFLTHMCGIRYRCSNNTCSRHIQKGELLGFAGNASGSKGVWAPHLHMTFYTYPSTSTGLYTSPVESLYNLNPKGDQRVAGA